MVLNYKSETTPWVKITLESSSVKMEKKEKLQSNPKKKKIHSSNLLKVAAF